MVSINPIQLYGCWSIGYALDLHTISSAPIGYNDAGHMQYDSTRSEIGQLLYDLKYSKILDAATDIIDTAYNFIINTYLAPPTLSFNMIVPVPPSSYRTYQPVHILAKGIANKLNVPLTLCINSESNIQVKNIQDQEERNNALKNKYSINAGCLKGMSVLLIDDLYRSGSTLNVISELIYQQGNALRVDALTITKTRANR